VCGLALPGRRQHEQISTISSLPEPTIGLEDAA
jgi:hypothetical protein